MTSRIIRIVALAMIAAVFAPLLAAAGPLEDARAAIARGELETARGILEPFLAGSPSKEDAGEALYLLGSASTDAVKCYQYDQQLLGEYKNHARAPFAALRSGQYLYATGEYERAATIFHDLEQSKDGPLRADGALWLGVALLEIGEFGQAREAFRMAEGSERLSGAARLGEGDSFRAESKLEDALDRYRDAAEVADSPWRAAALYKAGLAARALNRTDEARGYFETLAQLFPASSEAALALAYLPPPETSAPPAAPAPAEAPPETSGASGAVFSVQVGAFSERGNAARLYDQITQQGFPDPRIVPEPSGEGVLYTVRFGRYATEDAAAQAGREFAGAAGLTFQTVAEGGAAAESTAVADTTAAPDSE